MRELIRVLLVLVILFSLSLNLKSQTYVNKDWVRETPPGATAIFHTSTIVNAGKIYVTGNKLNGSGNTDIYTIQINATTGDTLWSSSVGGSASGDDYGVELKFLSGNLWVIGAALNTGTGYDFKLLKYNASTGSLLATYNLNGAGNGDDIPSGILVESSAVYVCGGSEATNGFSDIIVHKWNFGPGSGWTKYYDYNSLHDGATSIVSGGTNVVVTGGSASAVGDWDLATLKVHKLTGTMSSTRTNIAGATMVEAFAMTTDALNSVYVTGYAVVSGEKNIQTVKLDSNLALVWIKEYTSGGNDDVGRDVAVDASGNVFVVGYTELNSGANKMITIKYNSTGTELWDEEFGNTDVFQDARAEKIEVADNGNVFVTGTIATGGQESIELTRYNTNGKLTMHKTIQSDTINYRAYNLVIADNDIYVSGLSHTNAIGTFTVAKYSVFDKDQSIVYNDTIPVYVDDMVLIRFNPNDLILSKVDDTNIRWGIVGDFLDSTACAVISDSVGFDVRKQKCYKIFPNFKSSDTVATSRFGDVVSLPPYYATFGLVLPDNTDDSTAIVEFNSVVQHVIMTGHNLCLSPTIVPNDSYYTAGHFAGLEPTGTIPNANINIEDAWDYATGIPSVVVGVYDGGLNYAHNDWSNGTFSSSSVTGGYDYVNDIPLTSSSDPDNNGHGTAIGGLIGAWTNNSYGVAGIAGGNGSPGVSLHDMKYYDYDNYTPLPCNELKYGLTLEDILGAIVEGASGSGHISVPQDIQNHSWMINNPPNVFIREAFMSAYHLGVVLVCTSGNNSVGSSCTAQIFPGNYPDHMIIQVGANDATGAKATFSNCPSNLDLIAPGTHDLYICLGHQGNDFVDGTQYCYMLSGGDWLDGTSLAAPHVAGVAGLMLSYCETNSLPDAFAHEDCEYLMERNATDLTASPNYPGPDLETGWGRLDAGATFDHLWYPKYIISHEGFGATSTNGVLVGYHERTCLEQGMFGLPAGSVIYINRYEITATGSHSAPPGYNLIDGWARGSSSINMIGIASTPNASLVNCSLSGNDYFLPAEQNPTLNTFSTTSATMTGYTYQILDYAYNVVGWWPVNLSADVSFAYTLYWENPLLNGVTEENISAFSIYPNPTNSTCTIQLSDDLTDFTDIILLDVTGQMVQTIATTNNLSTGNSVIFDVTGLSQGVYFVAVRTEEKNIVQKLIIN